MHGILGVLIWTVGALSALLEGSVTGLIPSDYRLTTLTLEDVTTGDERQYHLGPNGTFAVVVPPTPEGFIFGLESSSLSLPWRYHVVSKGDGETLIYKVLHGHGINDHAAQLGQPLVISEWTRKRLVTERPVFSIWEMIRTPSVAMSLVALGMVFVAPKLTSLAEEQEEAAEDQKGGEVNVVNKK